VDILPYLAGKKDGDPHEDLYWRFGRASAIREGDWKLLRPVGQAPKLFNLAADISEKNDLSSAQAAKVKDLGDKLDRWNAQLKAPLWGPAPRNPARAARQNRQNPSLPTPERGPALPNQNPSDD